MRARMRLILLLLIAVVLLPGQVGAGASRVAQGAQQARELVPGAPIESLFQWRMKPDGDPEMSSSDNLFIVESQGMDRRAPTRGEANDPNSTPTPSEVLMPDVGARVEQSDRLSHDGIEPLSPVALVLIAAMTG
jgi:hypothetical protein